MATNPADSALDLAGDGASAPKFDPATIWGDLGSTGLRSYGGVVREEFLRQLTGRQGALAYREMLDNDPSVGGLIASIGGVMRKVEWRTEAVDDSDQAREAAEFADSLRQDMSATWEDFVVEALSMLPFGFSAHEVVYKRREGYQRPGGKKPTSRYTDGLVGIKNLPIRAQETVVKWFLGRNGDVLGMRQQPYVGPTVDIPVEKLLLFRPSRHKNNPEGRSVLRNAYVPYTYVKRLQESEAILFSRMSGLPVMEVPNQLLEAAGNGDPRAISALNAYKKIVTNVRIDEQMGMIVPSDVYQGSNGPTSNQMFKFRLEAPSGAKSAVDVNPVIQRYKTDMLYSVLADFLAMGHTTKGAQNLAETKVDVFMQMIEGWLNSIGAVLNRHLLPRVWALNGFDMALMPKYVPDLAQRLDLDALGNFIQRCALAGMPLFPDAPLEGYLRETAGLPDVVKGEDHDRAAKIAELVRTGGVDPDNPGGPGKAVGRSASAGGDGESGWDRGRKVT